MIKFPLNSKWSQYNSSDKFGSISYSKNINLDKEGYLKLSPRTVNIFDETSTYGDVDFGIPVSFGRYDAGQMYICTTDEPFTINYSPTSKTITEDNSSNNPNLTGNSHGVWWQNRFYESTSTAVYYYDGSVWTADAIIGLTSGVRHYMAVFKNKNSLAVSNGNTVKLYNTSHSNTITLTLPSDFEVIGLAYNNNKLGITTRLGSGSSGQNSNSYFFVWDGATTEANAGYSIGTDTAFSIDAYKSSFVVCTNAGQLLYYNGGGFEELAHFPFYNEEKRTGFDTILSYGDSMVVDGDIIYINVNFNFDGSGSKEETYLQSNPSGVWCYDPNIGLYHRYSPSISKVYSHTIVQANVNTTTGVFTTGSTIPNSGGIVINSSGTIGGISRGKIYYVIKITPTTFKIAETYEDAINMQGITITSADTINYFLMYDVVDYGASFSGITGGIALWGNNTSAYRDIIFGGSIYNSSLSLQDSMFSSVPFLENRGYVVLPRLFTNAKEENIQSIIFKHSPLDINDALYIKFKKKNVFGLPTSSPNGITNSYISWTSDTTGTSTSDLSEAKSCFDSGDELELEIISGIGGGQMIKITNITESSGTYTITVEESVVGYTSGAKSYFVIDNWKVYGSVNYDTQKNGILEIPIAESTKSPEIKIELRGYQTTIEDIIINNNTHSK